MAERKQGFDLAAVLGGVSDLNTGAEQIVRLPLDLLDPDPENFYSLDGLDELAANIELVGLLDPIRVRPNGERYTVVSGHRRRAACLLIRDGGSEQFKGGVPCIVEYGEASDAMRKLRLIYANSSTRQLSSAELSRQAEEVTRLLYELKEQGVDFPGRMRDHVAQAVGVTKSKLARLDAIRHNAWEDVSEAFDLGKINESVAYTFSRLDRPLQRRIWVNHIRLGYKPEAITAEYVDKLAALYGKLLKTHCKKNPNVWCAYAEVRFDYAQKLTHFEGVRSNCYRGRCCIGCPDISDCEYACLKCSDERAQAINDRERQKREREADLSRQQDAWKRDREQKDEECADIWERIRRAAEENGLELEGVFDQLFDNDGSVEQLLRWCEGTDRDEHHFALDLLDEQLIDLADLLGCSVDFLLGRTEVVLPAGITGGGRQIAAHTEDGDPDGRFVNRPYEEDGDGGTPGRIPPAGEMSAQPTKGGRTPSPTVGDAAEDPDGEIYMAWPAWQTGTPEHAGRYFCRVKGNLDGEDEPAKEFRFDWDGEQWFFTGRPILKGMLVLGWWPLPDKEE